tara:strand:+ start:73 stop:774 length:702 start_codon:yes stop_codon:yes gene_type:complete
MNIELIRSLPVETLKLLIELAKNEIRERKKLVNREKRRTFINKLELSSYDNAKQFNKDAHKVNSEELRSLLNKERKPQERSKYLPALIDQDWSHLYPCESSTGNYYVYAHSDPSDRIFTFGGKHGGSFGGQPFYIGKGIGDRAYNLKRNQGHGKKIKEVIDEGWDSIDIVHICFSGLSEQKALEIESKLIYFFGTKYDGGKSGTLYNLDTPKKPDFVRPMVKIALNKQFEVIK